MSSDYDYNLDNYNDDLYDDFDDEDDNDEYYDAYTDYPYVDDADII
jgi:hypothetical protein